MKRIILLLIAAIFLMGCASDMQKELNQVWDILLPALNSLVNR